ncbi:glutamate-rich protein 6 [Discoglossus pictus]
MERPNITGNSGEGGDTQDPGQDHMDPGQDHRDPGQDQWDPGQDHSRAPRKNQKLGAAHIPRILKTLRREDDYTITSQIRSKSDSALLLPHKMALGTSVSLQTNASWLNEHLSQTPEFPGYTSPAAIDHSSLSDHDEDLYSSLSDDLSELSIMCDMEFSSDYAKFFEDPLQTLPSVGPPTIMAYKRESTENERLLAKMRILQEQSEKEKCEFCGKPLEPFPFEDMDILDMDTLGTRTRDSRSLNNGTVDKGAVGKASVNASQMVSFNVEVANMGASGMGVLNLGVTKIGAAGSEVFKMGAAGNGAANMDVDHMEAFNMAAAKIVAAGRRGTDMEDANMGSEDMVDVDTVTEDKVIMGKSRKVKDKGTGGKGTLGRGTMEKGSTDQDSVDKGTSDKVTVDRSTEDKDSAGKCTAEKGTTDKQFCCQQFKDVYEFLTKEKKRVFKKHMIESISVDPHGPFGSEVERRRAKERTAQRIRDRQMAKLFASMEIEPTTTYSEYGKPLKTLSYQLSNAPPAGDSWTVLPEANVDESYGPEYFDLESVGQKLNADMLDPELTYFDFTMTSEKMMPAHFVEKYYSNGTKFLTMFPDGTAQIFYPSGNLAVIVTTNKMKETICIVQEDKANNAEIRAMFSSLGKATCYHANGFVWLNINPVGGQVLDDTGRRVRRWKWKDIAFSEIYIQFKPIFISLNHQVGVRIFAQDQMFVSFLAMGKQAKFNVGNRRLKQIQVQGMGSGIQQKRDIEEDELLLFAIKIKILVLLNKMHDCLNFPSNQQWYRIKPPTFLLSQAQKLLYLCSVCNISKDVDSSIRDIIGNQVQLLCA